MDDWLALMLVGLSVVYLLRAIWQSVRGIPNRVGCGCGKACPSAIAAPSGPATMAGPTRQARLPIVPLTAIQPVQGPQSADRIAR